MICNVCNIPGETFIVGKIIQPIDLGIEPDESVSGQCFQICHHTKLSAFPTSLYLPTYLQGGRCWGTAGPAVPERSGSSPKGRTPNIRYFVAKLSNVAIYALYEWPP